MDKQIETPLYQIYYKYHGVVKKDQVKDESKNISGSIKDRPARMIIEDAYQKGLIHQDTTICEVTSGNMGIALATIAKDYGNPVIICMPQFMSQERKEILNRLGVKLILTNSFEEAFQIAEKLAVEQQVFLTKQFENPNNAKAYIEFCKELEKKTTEFPAVIAGVGTGGTINGIGHYLKEKYQTKVYALEPLQTLILSTGISHGHHRIEGLSDGFVPDLYPKDIVDQIISVDDNDAICMAQKLKQKLGLNVGISSGANFIGAVMSDVDGIITVFPDDDTKYYSTDLMNVELNSKLVDEIELLYFEVI